MTLPKYDIFLSYKSDDSAWTERLRDDLRKRGVKVWLDKHEIRPGDLFAEALEKGLESSRSVGLIVTEKSLASGWVKEEYYRALSLSKAHDRPLIPILLENASLPGFLASRNYIDFRLDSDYEENIDTLIWPGITGRKIKVIFHNIPVWFDLEDWVQLTKIIRKSPIELCEIDEPCSLKSKVLPEISEGFRTVVIFDPFQYWPWKEDTLEKDSANWSIEEVFELRELTRGTEDETVFALYTHPDALFKAPCELDRETQNRLRHYYSIPMIFFDAKEGKKPTKAQQIKLQSSWKNAWYRIQGQFIANERRFLGKSLKE